MKYYLLFFKLIILLLFHTKMKIVLLFIVSVLQNWAFVVTDFFKLDNFIISALDNPTQKRWAYMMRAMARYIRELEYIIEDILEENKGEAKDMGRKLLQQGRPKFLDYNISTVESRFDLLQDEMRAILELQSDALFAWNEFVCCIITNATKTVESFLH